MFSEAEFSTAEMFRNFWQDDICLDSTMGLAPFMLSSKAIADPLRWWQDYGGAASNTRQLKASSCSALLCS